MKIEKIYLLVINAGSSSIKFAVYEVKTALTSILSGSLESIGSTNSRFSYTHPSNKEVIKVKIEMVDYDEAINYLMEWLEIQVGFHSVKAIGHRVVHGMKHKNAKKITAKLISDLKKFIPLSPEHLPFEIQLIELFAKRYPKIEQVACFDTSFHSEMPTVAALLPIPRKYFTMGIQRYGFHGLSYAYIMQELIQIEGKKATQEKIILAHLGNGASMAAINKGKCIDTSMGFTPSSGLVMGTRSGDLDPGLAGYLMQEEQFTIQEFNELINHKSGLLGISETTSDMEELIKIKHKNSHAADAFNLFCYQAKKYIGAYTAALHGLNTLVFSGGIGENSPIVRSEICSGLGFLGIELDEVKNQNNDAIISTNKSKVKLRVMKTNEQFMIAKMLCNLLDYPIKMK